MASESIDSILLAMNDAREARIAARTAARDSILVSNDYQFFDKLLAEASTRAKARIKTKDEPDSTGTDSESGEPASGT